MDSPQFKPCSSDADCYGCAPKCIFHEGGGADCRGEDGEIDGCSTYFDDSSTAFSEPFLPECFPSAYIECSEHGEQDGEQMSWACEDDGVTVETVPSWATQVTHECPGFKSNTCTKISKAKYDSLAEKGLQVIPCN